MANHNKRKQCNEPMRTRSKYTSQAPSAGKRVWPSCFKPITEVVKQNQSNSAITFDTQLKAGLINQWNKFIHNFHAKQQYWLLLRKSSDHQKLPCKASSTITRENLLVTQSKIIGPFCVHCHLQSFYFANCGFMRIQCRMPWVLRSLYTTSPSFLRLPSMQVKCFHKTTSGTAYETFSLAMWWDHPLLFHWYSDFFLNLCSSLNKSTDVMFSWSTLS